MSNAEKKRQELAELQARAEELQRELTEDIATQPFAPEGFYTGYYATAGFMLGMFAAMASLLFNVVGSAIVGQYPLQLIRVYLTFPLGDRAMEVDTGLALATGCVLYLATGMLLGIVFHLALAWWAPEGPFHRQMAIATLLALLIWAINYYALLSWAQPALIDMSRENLIVNQVPWWVGAATHLVFGWTMVLLYPLGRFVPYRRPTESS